MAASDLAELLGGAGEDLGVEYKAWLDLADPETRAKLAKHLAALANHGGGYIVIGVDDNTRLPMGAPPADIAEIDQEAVAGIVKRYLSPPFQIQVETAEKDGVGYPVVVVPSHGQRPVMAIADGPTGPKGQPIGVSQGRIYVRAAGPQSIDIKNPDDWNALLDRCLSHRGDQLAKIMRQGIARPDRPGKEAIAFLLAAVEAAALDFSSQIADFTALVPETDREWVAETQTKFGVVGYALLDEGGDLVELDDLHGLAGRAALGLRTHANNGWSAFLPLTVPERTPQVRTEPMLGEDRSFLEGMRLPAKTLLSRSMDYWRIYEGGACVTAETFREDNIRVSKGGDLCLTVLYILFRFHSMLAHARMVGQERSGVTNVIVRMDWRGLKGRRLMWEPREEFVSPAQLADDRFAKTVTVPWAELRDDYVNALIRVVKPFVGIFPPAGWPGPDQWLNRETIEREFRKYEMGSVRLFD